MKVDAEIVSTCRSCGQSDVEFEVVSSHRTAQGVVRYVRCECGALQMLFRSRLDSGERPLLGAPRVAAVA